EKSFGAPEAQISPRLPKFGPLPKRFFSRHNPKALMSLHHLRINRMKHKNAVDFVAGRRTIKAAIISRMPEMRRFPEEL
ncbi:MAG TPA: hypothetical protein VMX36_01330, partial [Sedimentisphaerales bacterium]|nr:hypothetical protein [Sedimentisphaerales bacterium]